MTNIPPPYKFDSQEERWRSFWLEYYRYAQQIADSVSVEMKTSTYTPTAGASGWIKVAEVTVNKQTVGLVHLFWTLCYTVQLTGMTAMDHRILRDGVVLRTIDQLSGTTGQFRNAYAAHPDELSAASATYSVEIYVPPAYAATWTADSLCCKLGAISY